MRGEQRKVVIRNVYYMLAYVFHYLGIFKNKGIEVEKLTHDTQELLEFLIVNGIATILKLGLSNDYVQRQEQLGVVKGKLILKDSIGLNNLLNFRLACQYEDYTGNTYKNRILKTTIDYILRSNPTVFIKDKIQRLNAFFKYIDPLPPNQLNWNLTFRKGESAYQVTLGLCRLFLEKLFLTTEKGKLESREFFNEKLIYKIFEEFIFEYCFQEQRNLFTMKPEIIPQKLIRWGSSIDKVKDKTSLPEMHADLFLKWRIGVKNNVALILDTKCYSSIWQSNPFSNAPKFRNANLYQIQSYVYNYQYAHTDCEVRGALLYAGTSEDYQPDDDFYICGNHFFVKTLSLDNEFVQIKKDLNSLFCEVCPEIAKDKRLN